VQSIRCRIGGKVQGVWFRAGTAQQAKRLGVTGSARNLPDGTVELIAHGSPEALSRLVQWLWQGTPLSEVTAVDVEHLEVESERIPQEFITR
jgi:acylphosphatase